MKDWHVFSSGDLINWTDHGACLSVKGDFYKMDMGGYEPQMEGPWIFKRNEKYYFTMPEGNRVLTYYMSDSPKGPWTYKGVIMEEEHNLPMIVQFTFLCKLKNMAIKYELRNSK